MCTAAAGFAGVTALAIAELSGPRLLPRARAVCSAAACFRAALRRLSTMTMHGCSGAARWGAWCAGSCRWLRRCDGAGNCRIKRTEAIASAQAVCFAATCFRAVPRCLNTIMTCGCSVAAKRAACFVHSCRWIRRYDGAGNCRISTAEASAACISCLLCHGLFSWDHSARVRGRDVWVQQRCLDGA
jgi:hypothetical protein